MGSLTQIYNHYQNSKKGYICSGYVRSPLTYFLFDQKLKERFAAFVCVFAMCVLVDRQSETSLVTETEQRERSFDLFTSGPDNEHIGGIKN